MDTLLPASAHNVDGCIAFVAVIIVLAAVWAFEHRSAAEHITQTKIYPKEKE